MLIKIGVTFGATALGAIHIVRDALGGGGFVWKSEGVSLVTSRDGRWKSIDDEVAK